MSDPNSPWANPADNPNAANGTSSANNPGQPPADMHGAAQTPPNQPFPNQPFPNQAAPTQGTPPQNSQFWVGQYPPPQNPYTGNGYAHNPYGTQAAYGQNTYSQNTSGYAQTPYAAAQYPGYPHGPFPNGPQRKKPSTTKIVLLSVGGFLALVALVLAILTATIINGVSRAVNSSGTTPYLPSVAPRTVQPSEAVPTTASAPRALASPVHQTGVVTIHAFVDETSGFAGTGMIVSEDGLVLTNYHVVRGATYFVEVIVATTGKTYTASVLGHDATNDVALLRLDDASGLDTVTVDDDPLGVGDDVVTVGGGGEDDEIWEAEGVLTSKSTNATLSDTDGSTHTMLDVYSTSTRAIHGDSGGPTFDDEFEVVGMTTGGQEAGPSEVAEAIVVPIARAVEIANKISANKPDGTIVMGP